MESQQEERDCEHFSIRGYTAEMRTKDFRRCNIFESNDSQSNSNEETPILPPLTVGKFKSWHCSNCLRVSAADDAAGAAGSISTPTGSDMPPPPSEGLVILQPNSNATPPMLDNIENAILLSDNSVSDPTPPVLDNLENAILVSDNSDSDPTPPPVLDNLENVILLSDNSDSDPTPSVLNNLEKAILLSDSEPTPPALEKATIADDENVTGNDMNQEIGDMISDEMETNSKGSVPDPENGSRDEKNQEIIVHPSGQEMPQKSRSEEADQSNENQEIGHPECDEMEAHPQSSIQHTHSEAGFDNATWKGKAVVEFGEPSCRSAGTTQNLECETPKVADTTDEARANVVESHANETPILLAENTQHDDEAEEDDVNYPRNPRKMRLLSELSAPNRGRCVAAVRGNHTPRWSGYRKGKRKMDQETCPPRKQSKRAKTFRGDAEISDSGPINSGDAVRRRRTPRLHLGKPTQLLESNQIEIRTNAEKDCVDQNEKFPDHTLPAVSDAQNLVLLGNGAISHQQDFLYSRKKKSKNITLKSENDDILMDTMEMDIIEMMATRMYTCKRAMHGNDVQLCPPAYQHKEIELKTYARRTTASQLASLLDTSMPFSSNVDKFFSPSNREPKQEFHRSIQEQSKVYFPRMRPPPSLFAQTSKRREKLPPVRPRERKSRKLDIGICSLNRNPGEFTVPASTHEFMISGADLKLINWGGQYLI